MKIKRIFRLSFLPSFITSVLPWRKTDDIKIKYYKKVNHFNKSAPSYRR